MSTLVRKSQEKIPRVVSARTLTRMLNGKRKVCQHYCYLRRLPEYVKLGFVSYVVRAFVSKPVQCGNCKGYGHVSTVCRRWKYNLEKSVLGTSLSDLLG